ncbi:Adaptin ear-binding coat-associated protein 2 [Neolecta irregularis DAH-3]|uniref:Adaptin ear-binding coat-associated protein 2 n=1 Tax=Neolecta irregularis (strain DAH-3) TaxID=1198029 RepID=A0A1U7LG99_NEOID|nr:Adaptin ear-binding coat-associated protein 2 [Neolecta irregularis DAH-3]|eukprot:OLL21680.1 Adaptin ear-binding coat-associated protein 2 [Neolecta irregularis DAH-3]
MLDDSQCTVQFQSTVQVYRIPPRASSKGHRASDWGDLDKSLWSGRLRILETDTECEIRLEDSNTGELFAACPYISTHVVEPVLDSSRFFVITVVDQGRRAYLGIGFQEKTDAFDLNVALQDFRKRQLGVQEAKKKVALPPKDYSLKEGETITVNIGQKQRTVASRPATASEIDEIFIPPPPSVMDINRTQSEAVNEAFDDDAWGDFQ